MRRNFNYSFLSNDKFHIDKNSLERFLKYCLRQCSSSDQMGIFLTETDVYFLLEVKIESYDGALEPSRFYVEDGEIRDSVFNHPFVRLASEICGAGHFAEIQSTTEDSGYGLNIETTESGFEVEHFDQNIQVDGKETLYMVAFNSDISEVWETVRDFCENSDVDYYINPLESESMKVL